MTPTQRMGLAFAIGGIIVLFLVVCCCIAAGAADKRKEQRDRDAVHRRAVAAGFINPDDRGTWDRELAGGERG